MISASRRRSSPPSRRGQYRRGLQCLHDKNRVTSSGRGGTFNKTIAGAVAALGINAPFHVIRADRRSLPGSSTFDFYLVDKSNMFASTSS